MRKLSLFFGVLFLLTAFGCSKETISYIDPAGEYAVNFSFPEGEITAPAKVVLINRSKYSDKYQWVFDNAQAINKAGEVYDIESSEQIIPDTLFYALPGTYEVGLTAWQGGKSESISKKIVVKKMQPQINVPENIGMGMSVVFSADAFVYPGQPLTYSWDFGEGGTSTEANPTVTFKTEGDHAVKLTVNDGQESLSTEIVINVMGELVRTIYFTDGFSRRIYKYRLTEQSTPQVEWIGVLTGYNALGLTVRGNKLYLSETGFGTRFSSGDAAKADGVLKSFNLDGSGENIISKPVLAPLDYRNDPWMSTVDKYGDIWWTTRNYGGFVLKASGTDLPYPVHEPTNMAKIKIDATIAGGPVSTYFASDVKEVGDEMWMSYAGTTGKGIYKFRHDGTYVGKFTTAIQAFAIRTFVVDHVNGHIYFASNRANGELTEGIYRSNLDGTNVVAIDNGPSMLIGTAGGYSNQGAAGEYVYVTNMDIAVDEDGSGYLYYGYRANTDINGSGNPVTLGASAANSGIKKYNLNGSEAPSFLFKGYAPYGLAIDQVKR